MCGPRSPSTCSLRSPSASLATISALAREASRATKGTSDCAWASSGSTYGVVPQRASTSWAGRDDSPAW